MLVAEGGLCISRQQPQNTNAKNERIDWEQGYWLASAAGQQGEDLRHLVHTKLLDMHL